MKVVMLSRGLTSVIDARDYNLVSGFKWIAVKGGKGRGRRSFSSAARLNGKARIRAIFTSEKQALSFERRLIESFRPINNFVFNRDGFIPLDKQFKQ